MDEIVYTFETKCRRCGKINEWFYGSSNTVKEVHWVKYQTLKYNDSGIYYCNKCKKTTVQDPVAFFKQFKSKIKQP